MCTEKIRTLSQSGFEKIALLYFYISAFCRLTDRLTDKTFIGYILRSYMRGMCIEKN